MEIYCTRPACPRPQNFFADLDDRATLQTAQQKFCTTCGMPLILVGRYLPSKLLGKGGFGTAFLARDRYTPAMRQCVVKQFQPSGDLSPPQLRIAQELFEREAAVLEQLGSTHPQIPDLFAFFPLSVPSLQPGKEDQFFYLVQEFIDGQDLEKELQTKGPYSEAEALEVLKQILKVLKFVHKNGSIHRDIKPSNIMRDRNGRLFLLDFGAVKQVTTVPVQTGRSTGIYSMGFAPPEQMSGGQVYPSTDLYALAVTVITLLTGKEAVELFDSYNNQWNWQNYVQVSDTLANILDKMLLAAPNQRFQSAQEVIEALTPQQTPSPPPPPPVPQPPITPPVQQTPVNPPPIPSNPQPIARSPAFSLLEVLGGAAFTGFEGGLILIVFTSLLKSPQISIGLLGMIVGLLIYLQYRRFIEGKDRPIIAVITLLAVMLIGPLHGSILPLIKAYSPIIIIFAATIGGALAIAAYALFRLIYLVLSRLLS